MNNPFEYVPEAECDAAFRVLTDRVESLKASDRPEDIAFVRELQSGKMLGVLIAEEGNGARHTLFAFSGQLGDGGLSYPGFVGAPFDYLRPDGYFKTKEAEISDLNKEISRFEKLQLAKAFADYLRAKETIDNQIVQAREEYRQAKLERENRRKSGLPDEAELAAMIRRSQFEKAELHRLKKRLAADLDPLQQSLEEAKLELAALKERRRSESETLQDWLFSNFRLLNARGESKSLKEIFAGTALKIPPSGAGECCAPKLLQAAYIKGWKPMAIAEYWYGESKKGEVRIHGEHYPACRGKCLPILGWMLQGLEVQPPLDRERLAVVAKEPEVIFENEWFCVVDKPSGMLTVPGKGNAVSLQQWLMRRYGAGANVKMAHRLDQDTSGLVVATFGEQAYKVMQSLFARRQVRKTYIADLEGAYEELGIPRCGYIDLPLSPDWLDRPRQRVDIKGGKEALTEYEFLTSADGRSRVVFHPQTGRTHQLRVHAASAMGLGMPIVGDRLYGRNGGKAAERLHLQAARIEFTFPLDGKSYYFDSPLPF